jgi:glycine/D-amino acid oxidase-like deaminating enzyme
MTARYGAHVYWLETAPHTPRPPLRERRDVDVVIVGGGYTGLWTAYHLLQAEPSLDVAVVEREEIGFGASGRNGGFAMTLLDFGLVQLRRHQGGAAVKAAHEAIAASVDEIGDAVARHRIDCDWVKGGLMVVATNPVQLQRVEADLAVAEELGLAGFRRLSSAEAQHEVHSPTYLGGMFEPHCGVVHPAKLARGLARVVEGLGAAIYEDTGLVRLDEVAGRLRVTTSEGELRCEQLVVATNAWAASTPWFRRKILPLYTYILLTEPLTDSQWAAVGWERHQGIEDKRNLVHYYRRTADGRILWGDAAGLVFPAGNRIGPTRDRHEATFAEMERDFRETFPQLAGMRFTHRWGGPVAMTATAIPLFGSLLDGRIHYGLGYNGHGVAPSHTGGKVLRDKVLAKSSPYTELCFVDAPEPAFPGDPLLWLGTTLTRRSLRRRDRRFAEGRGSGDMDPLILRLARKLG